MDQLDYRVTLYQKANAARSISPTDDRGVPEKPNAKILGVGYLSEHPRVSKGDHLLLEAKHWEFANWEDGGIEKTGGALDPIRGRVIAVRWVAHDHFEKNVDAELIVSVPYRKIKDMLEEGQSYAMDFYWGE